MAADTIAKKVKAAADKGEESGKTPRPYCSLEGKECRERVGYKASDDEGHDEDLEDPEGMPRTVPGVVGDSESNKASKGEPKELKLNGTVKVEMAKWFPNQEKLKRINETKKKVKEEEETREKDKEKRANETKERKKKRAEEKKTAKLIADKEEKAKKAA